MELDAADVEDESLTRGRLDEACEIITQLHLDTRHALWLITWKSSASALDFDAKIVKLCSATFCLTFGSKMKEVLDHKNSVRPVLEFLSYADDIAVTSDEDEAHGL